MLVLSRQRDETIMIGDEVEITVVDIRGDKVRLGITAPTRIAVHRKEVYEAIKRENEHAARFQNGLEPRDLDAIEKSISPGPAKTRSRTASRLAARAEPAPAPLRPGETRPASNGAHP
jgi:carbon storage regulator